MRYSSNYSQRKCKSKRLNQNHAKTKSFGRFKRLLFLRRMFGKRKAAENFEISSI